MTEDIRAALSRVAALEHLLETLESSTLEQGARLEAEQERLKQVLANAPASVSILKGADHIISYANPKAVSSSPDLLNKLGLPMVEAFPELADQGYIGLLDRVFSSGEPYLATEAPIAIDRDSDGEAETVYVDFALIPTRNPEGEVDGLVAFSYEVTQLVMARQEAEALAKDLDLLATASARINGDLSLAATAQEAADQARRIVGSHRAVCRIRAKGSNDEWTFGVSLSDEFSSWREHDERSSTDGPHVQVMSTGEPLRLTAAQLKERPEWQHLYDPVGRPPIGAWLGVPITSRASEVIGVIYATNKYEEDFTDSDEAILVQLGQLTASAFQNSLVFERERRVAETLQRSLLPSALPRLPGLEMAARYRPGSSEAQVGGDWYDSIELDDGSVVIAIGDVVGKGVRAAALMGQLRIALQAYALEGHEPDEIMGKLDRLLQKTSPESMATAFVGKTKPGDDLVSFASAGHLPPILLSSQGVDFVKTAAIGPPLGAAESPYQIDGFSLEINDIAILFTDGLVERRGHGIDSGMAELKELVGSDHSSLSDILDRVMDASENLDHKDDVAMLAIRRLTPRD